MDFEDNSAFVDWDYFNYLIYPREVFGLIFVVRLEYLEVCVALLKPELVALVKLAELRPNI